MSDHETTNRCGVGIRGVAMGIDSAVWFLLFIVALTIVGVATGQAETTASGLDTDLEGTPAAMGLALWLGLSIGYHTLLEWRFGKTIGKALVRIQVVRADGSPASFGASLTRNLLRLVDWLPAFYLVGILALALSEKRSRLGDRAAGTAVVRV
ncbi:RDD family protein [Halorientalis halophila]|uniref:RDD family protein n=1 Tax=Halorientalis halophila TaxID=3108499 RepID=UPI00300BC9DE